MSQSSPPLSPVREAVNNVKKIGSKLQRFNIIRLIDEMEHDQELADRLEQVNRDIDDEKEVLQLRVDCLQDIQVHLENFVREHPDGSYEDWIRNLHPENGGKGSDGDEIDHRFYVDGSDHRKMWNESLSPSSEVVADGDNNDKSISSSRSYVPVRDPFAKSLANETTATKSD